MQRTVVVTGCSSGLGESVSHALLNSYDVLGWTSTSLTHP